MNLRSEKKIRTVSGAQGLSEKGQEELSREADRHTLGVGWALHGAPTCHC